MILPLWLKPGLAGAVLGALAVTAGTTWDIWMMSAGGKGSRSAGAGKYQSAALEPDCGEGAAPGCAAQAVPTSQGRVSNSRPLVLTHTGAGSKTAAPIPVASARKGSRFKLFGDG